MLSQFVAQPRKKKKADEALLNICFLVDIAQICV